METITRQKALEILHTEYGGYEELDEDFDPINCDDYDWVKETYPKAWELIQKLDDNQQYVNLDDYQGGSWAVGLCGTAKAWALHICSWADSDGYKDDYENPKENSEDISTTYLCPLMNYFKSEEEVIENINEIWGIGIQKLED